MPLNRRRALQTSAALLAASALPAARAQGAFPAAPLRIVIPVPAGGGYDNMMRLVGTKLTEAWGQPAIVESKPGASGSLAAGFVAKAPADGHTLLLTYSAFLANPQLMPNPGYRVADFTPVCMLVLSPIAIGVRSDLGVNTLQEYVAMARAQPGKLSYASYGQGSGGHFVGELFNSAAGIETTHVPYKGEAPALQDLLGGQVHAAIASVGGVSRYPGKIKALAVASATRFPGYKDVPTFDEAGVPGVDMPGWGGIFVPAATPRPVVDKLATELTRIILLPDVQARMLELGFQPVGWGADKLVAFMNDQSAKIKKLVDSGRVKI